MLALAPIFTGLARGLTESLIDSDEVKKWTRVVLDVLDSGTDLENRLAALHKSIEARLDADQHFGPEDFDRVVKEIAGRDQAWADLAAK